MATLEDFDEEAKAPVATRPGGKVEQGQQFIATPFPIKPADQIIWRGSAWRVEGSPYPEHIGGRAQADPQAAHVHVDGARVDVAAHLPDLVEQLLAREHAPGVADQEM